MEERVEELRRGVEDLPSPSGSSPAAPATLPHVPPAPPPVARGPQLCGEPVMYGAEVRRSALAATPQAAAAAAPPAQDDPRPVAAPLPVASEAAITAAIIGVDVVLAEAAVAFPQGEQPRHNMRKSQVAPHHLEAVRTLVRCFRNVKAVPVELQHKWWPAAGDDTIHLARQGF